MLQDLGFLVLFGLAAHHHIVEEEEEILQVRGGGPIIGLHRELRILYGG